MKHALISGCLAVILASCTAPPAELNSISALQSPASTTQAIQTVPYAPVIQDYQNYTPTDPQSWQKSNEEQNSGWGQ